MEIRPMNYFDHEIAMLSAPYVGGNKNLDK
jgi:hypothetical protein